MALSFEEARGVILDSVQSLGAERVPLLEAAGRVLAEPIIAPWDIPYWDNSAMDGYALRVADLGALPTTLPVHGYVPAGGEPLLNPQPGCAVKIMTGAPIPPGCDAVVPFEETVERAGEVTIAGPVRSRDHIRFRGEDVAAGELVIPAGTVLRPAEINMLASFGRALVPTHRRVRVAILSTGDELVELGEPLGPGQIINSNSYSLAAAVREIGGEPLLLGIARDNIDSHRRLLAEGLKADVLITSAGVSAGDRDLVREVLAELGVEQRFWKIDIKPGRPTAFGLRGGTPVFALPGNPVSTMITFEELVRPALLKMMGHSQVIKPYVRAVLREPVGKKAGRVQFLRVQVRTEGERLLASSAGDQNTGILRTMVRANGIAVLPAAWEEVAAGTEVDVHLIGWLP
jgi:molybdopterin molybdotransferase